MSLIRPGAEQFLQAFKLCLVFIRFESVYLSALHKQFSVNTEFEWFLFFFLIYLFWFTLALSVICVRFWISISMKFFCRMQPFAHNFKDGEVI